MLNQVSLEQVAASRFSSTECAPLYGSYCFANIPGTLLRLFGGVPPYGVLPDDVFGSLALGAQKVLLFLVDGYGWQSWKEDLQKNAFLQRLCEQGILSKLTAQFPSTTAAEISTLETGLPVSQSGVYEWYYYEPLVDEIISPLIYSYARKKLQGSLQHSGLSPDVLFPKATFYGHLRELGVPSYLFYPKGFNSSPYNQLTSREATSVPYEHLSEAFTLLWQHLAQQHEKTYYYFYYGGPDSVAHDYGPASSHARAERELFLFALEKLFFDKASPAALRDTLVIITADHGLSAVSPKKTFYLNLEIPELIPLLRRNRRGELLVPGGSARDFFLYVEEKSLEQAYQLLAQRLASVAQVYRVSDLLAQDLFGPWAPGATFLSRLGNLLILPHEGEAVWWYEKGVFEQKHFGHHGGLSPAEMEIPFLVYRPHF